MYKILQTDRPTARPVDFSIPPQNKIWGYKYASNLEPWETILNSLIAHGSGLPLHQADQRALHMP